MSHSRSFPHTVRISPRRHRPRELRSLLAVIVVLLGAPRIGHASQTLGGQFQVNVFTGSSQYQPAVATNAAGDFILAWESWGSAGNDNSGTAVEGTVAIGGEFQVNTSTLNKQSAPAVAINASGEAVVAWQSAHLDVDNSRIMAQRYDVTGARVGPELTVSGGGNNLTPSVAMADSGDFVVVWQSNAGVGADPGPSKSIQGRRFKASSGGFMDQFLVNNITAGDQARPAIATDGDVTYLVVWEDAAASSDIAIRYFTATGSGSGMSANANQEPANTYTASAQNFPSVAMTPDGRALVAWESFSSAGPDPVGSIQARRLDAAGNFLDTDDVEVNKYTADSQRFPAVAVDANGIFSVTWSSVGSFGSDASGYSVQLRSVSASGIWQDPLDVQVNAYTPNYQWYSAAALLPDGYLFVVWESNGTTPGETDTDGYSIQGTLVDVFLFADGFETGDSSRWSSVSP